MTLKQLKAWHDTKKGLMVFGVVELLIAYVFASLAINSGSLWQYFLTLVLFIGGIQNFLKLVTK